MEMRADIIAKLGPLARLAGIWEGEKGDDVAPDDDRAGTEVNEFRERMTFEPFGPVDNHEQQLFGLRYTTTAWRLGEPDAFHEETGYWLWDPAAKLRRGLAAPAQGAGRAVPPRRQEHRAESRSVMENRGSRVVDR